MTARIGRRIAIGAVIMICVAGFVGSEVESARNDLRFAAKFEEFLSKVKKGDVKGAIELTYLGYGKRGIDLEYIATQAEFAETVSALRYYLAGFYVQKVLRVQEMEYEEIEDCPTNPRQQYEVEFQSPRHSEIIIEALALPKRAEARFPGNKRQARLALRKGPSERCWSEGSPCCAVEL
jgi:hypothetical protein